MRLGPRTPRRSRALLALGPALIGCAGPPAPEIVEIRPDSEAERAKLIAEIMPACPIDRLAPFIGQRLTEALQQEARRRSGLTLIRVRLPGEPYTQDLRSERLNIDVDGVGRVVRFVCG